MTSKLKLINDKTERNHRSNDTIHPFPEFRFEICCTKGSPWQKQLNIRFHIKLHNFNSCFETVLQLLELPLSDVQRSNTKE